MARLDRLALGPERPFPHHGHQLLWWLQATYWAVVHGWSYCGETLLAARLRRAAIAVAAEFDSASQSLDSAALTTAATELTVDVELAPPAE